MLDRKAILEAGFKKTNVAGTMLVFCGVFSTLGSLVIFSILDFHKFIFLI